MGSLRQLSSQNLRYVIRFAQRKTERVDRWDKQTSLDWIRNGRTKRKVWISLDVETVDSLSQENGEEWFMRCLGHVETLIVSLFNRSLQETHALYKALMFPYKQESGIDEFASTFHWLMRTGLPRFSFLNVIELIICGPMFEWGYSFASLLEHFSDTDYYLVYRSHYKFRSLEQVQAPLIYNNLKGLDLDESFKLFLEKYSTKLSKLPSSSENSRIGGSIEFDGLFDDCRNLKKFSVGALYLRRPLPDTIEVLGFSFDDPHSVKQSLLLRILLLTMLGG